MGFHTCNYYRFLDLVYKLSVSGEISKRLDSTGKTILLLNKFSGLIIWGVALLYVKTSYLFLMNERELHVTQNIMQFSYKL